MKLHCRFVLAGFTFLLLGFFTVNHAFGAPTAKLWTYWQAHDPESVDVVDHKDWDVILNRYVDARHPSGINRFHYGNVMEKNKFDLKNYLKKMAEIQVTRLNRTEQKAYWINLYNALTVHIILQYYPVKSIKDIDISPGIFNDGPWDAKLLNIEGQDISLNDIEHRILRPIWHDNRVHYAVNCASLGCPNLQPQAYTADNLEEFLEKGARQFINHPRGVKFVRDKLQVSSIYFWFQEDFGDSKEGVIKHLEKYLSDSKIQKLKTLQKGMKHQYDWSLNK
jgi:hypothetical protein